MSKPCSIFSPLFGSFSQAEFQQLVRQPRAQAFGQKLASVALHHGYRREAKTLSIGYGEDCQSGPRLWRLARIREAGGLIALGADLVA